MTDETTPADILDGQFFEATNHQNADAGTESPDAASRSTVINIDERDVAAELKSLAVVARRYGETSIADCFVRLSEAVLGDPRVSKWDAAILIRVVDPRFLIQRIRTQSSRSVY